jgi:hypothetical protein
MTACLSWAPPTPDEELAEWREAVIPVEGYPRGWVLDAYEDGRLWAWSLSPYWPSFAPVASGWAGTREEAMRACEEAARRHGALD